VGNLTLKSEEVILVMAFGVKTICDMKLHNQILPACGFLKVSSVQRKPKATVFKLLAQTYLPKLPTMGRLQTTKVGYFKFPAMEN